MGHSDTSVGTVETTVTRFATSHGPRSVPLRTSERGAGTRQAPWRQASHISSHEASKATDSPAMTRSPGPSGAALRNSSASASTKAAAARWCTATPLGLPVEPDVKMIHASSDAPGGSSDRSGDRRGDRTEMASPSPITAATSASANTVRARSSGSSTSTGTYAHPASSTPRIAT